jgi:hypothetical protein
VSQQINSGVFFIRIPHLNKGILANVKLKRAYFDKKILMNRKIAENDPKKFFSPKVTNHLKLFMDFRQYSKNRKIFKTR